VFAPNERTRSTGKLPTTASRVTADGKRIFRMTPPLVIWWGWVALLVFSVADLLIQGHEFVSAKYAFGALTATGIIYACTLWPKVIADDAGIEVRNPVRVFHIPWAAVRGIFLADSVEVQCARRSGKRDKTIYCWALASPRRTRARAQLKAWQWEQGKRNRPSGYAQLPESAQALVKMTTAEIMARELGALLDDARFNSVVEDVGLDAGAGPADEAAGRAGVADAGPADESDRADPDGGDEGGRPVADQAPPGVNGAADHVSSTWAWLPVAAICVPAVGFIVTLLVK
jgi:hypothetical protein